MEQGARSRDTEASVAAAQAAAWRAMTPADRARFVDELCADVDTLARAGIRMTHGELEERSMCRELVRRKFGARLADAAFGTATSP